MKKLWELSVDAKRIKKIIDEFENNSITMRELWRDMVEFTHQVLLYAQPAQRVEQEWESINVPKEDVEWILKYLENRYNGK